MKIFLKTFFLIAILGFISACTTSTSYIYDRVEYDRKSAAYLDGISDRSTVTVCTSNLSKKLLKEDALAETECNLFEKRSVFVEYSFSICPLVTPRALIYKCVANVK